MDFFLMMLGLAIVLWAINYDGGPLIKITRTKCDHERPRARGWIPPVDGGYIPRRQPQVRQPQYVVTHTAPEGTGGVGRNGARPQNVARPSETNVEPPEGGSGQAKMNLKKEDQ